VFDNPIKREAASIGRADTYSALNIPIHGPGASIGFPDTFAAGPDRRPRDRRPPCSGAPPAWSLSGSDAAVDQLEDAGHEQHHEHRWEDQEDQREQHADRRLLSPLLRLAPAA